MNDDDAIAELRSRVGIARLHGEEEVTVPTQGAYALNHRYHEACGWEFSEGGSMWPSRLMQDFHIALDLLEELGVEPETEEQQIALDELMVRAGRNR